MSFSFKKQPFVALLLLLLIWGNHRSWLLKIISGVFCAFRALFCFQNFTVQMVICMVTLFLSLPPLLLFFFIYLCQLEANYFTALQWFLSYIDMNQPWIYMYGNVSGIHPVPPSHLPLYLIPLGLPSAPGPSTCFMHPTWAGDLSPQIIYLF